MYLWFVLNRRSNFIVSVREYLVCLGFLKIRSIYISWTILKRKSNYFFKKYRRGKNGGHTFKTNLLSNISRFKLMNTKFYAREFVS